MTGNVKRINKTAKLHRFGNMMAELPITFNKSAEIKFAKEIVNKIDNRTFELFLT